MSFSLQSSSLLHPQEASGLDGSRPQRFFKTFLAKMTPTAIPEKHKMKSSKENR